MRIKVNKDFLTEYKDEFWKGFSVPEVISLVLGVTAMGAVAFLVYYFLGISPDTAIYFGLPAAVPFLAVGFVKYQTYLPLTQLAVEMIYTWHCRQLPFAAGEKKRPSGHFFYMQRRRKRGGKK